jgi:hypothetical protein
MSQYEFTADENRLIAQVGTKLRHISILFLALGALQLAQSFMLGDPLGRWISLGASLLLFGLGWLFYRPLDNLHRILTTSGKDIHEVVAAIKDLRAAYLAAEIIMLALAAGVVVEIMRLTTGTGL